MTFTPHTAEQINTMLAELDVQSINTLFEEIPDSLRLKEDLDVPSASKELEVARLMHERAQLDEGYQNFLGAGAYEHYIPAAVWDIATRGEFLTAYTPYQAEASQGGLQLIYEYQTMIASLMGLEAANASVYDGASAIAESVLMAVRQQSRRQAKRVIVVGSINPYYREVTANLTQWQGVDLETLAVDPNTGCVDSKQLGSLEEGEPIAAVVIQQPNFLGHLEEVDYLVDWAHKQQALAIAVVNPMTLGILKEPGYWGENGADIACGEGQPLGIPLSSGGPYFGFMACRKSMLRQMPGRIVGKTEDEQGRTGFTLTLQAREQHIRRAKAKSNICTNQGLMVTAATIYLSLQGFKGLEQTALICHNKATQLAKKLNKIAGINLRWPDQPFFHEFVIDINKPVDAVLNYCHNQGLLPGVELSLLDDNLSQSLLVCVTETKTDSDLKHYVETMQQALQHVGET